MPESKRNERPRIRTKADPGTRRVVLISFLFRHTITQHAISDKTKAIISGAQTNSNCAITNLYFQWFKSKRNYKGDRTTNQQVTECIHYHRHY